LFPGRYDTTLLRGVWTIRQFDDAYVAPHCGFRDSADYYERASALRVIDRISIPTLIIHAKDDPFIPFAQVERPEVSGNRNVTLLAPNHGGHVSFISTNGGGENRFWAEAMAIEFAKVVGE
jgi:predicted alpha/beta-fold hydrolase